LSSSKNIFVYIERGRNYGVGVDRWGEISAQAEFDAETYVTLILSEKKGGGSNDQVGKVTGDGFGGGFWRVHGGRKGEEMRAVLWSGRRRQGMERKDQVGRCRESLYGTAQS